MENTKDSLAQFKEGLQISQKLAETDARNAEAQRDLAGSHTKLGLVHRELKHMEDAKRSFQAGIDVLVRMIDAGQFVKQCEDEKKELEAELVKCNYTAE